VKVSVSWLVVAVPLLALLASCSGDALLSCTDDRRAHGRDLLTGTPQFTASEIAPGDPLSIMVPVNEYTSSVSVGIRLEDDPDAGRWPSIVLEAETEGDEIVQLPLEDTDLAPGTYFASVISPSRGEDLGGGEYLEDTSDYTSAQGDAPYILSWWWHAEVPKFRCQSDIPAPTFEVVTPSK
jgi:hypothetical protein